MPCRTEDSFNVRHYPSGVPQDQYDKLKKEADTTTRLLCSVMRKLNVVDSPSLIGSISSIDGLKDWWEHHQEVDRKRIEKEVADAKKSLGHLSPEAKELLIQSLQQSE